jgi:hypothetical protein
MQFIMDTSLCLKNIPAVGYDVEMKDEFKKMTEQGVFEREKVVRNFWRITKFLKKV